MAYDFSEPAERALAWAGTLAQLERSPLVLLHVKVDPFTKVALPADSSLWAKPEVWPRQQQALRNALQQVAAIILGPAPPFPLALRVERGVVGPSILAARAALGATLIVLGTTGKGGIARALMGSVSQHVLHGAPCPVLLVP